MAHDRFESNRKACDRYSVFYLHYSLCNGNAGATYNFRKTKTKANKQTDNKRQSRRQGRIQQKKENRTLPEFFCACVCVCVVRFRKIDRKPENDRGKMSFCVFVCVFVCVCCSQKERG